MRIIEPIQPTPATLTASSFSESDVAMWDASTSYTTGQEARLFVDGAYRIFEALIDNSDKDPSRQPVDENGRPYWLNTGATPRWAMFDGSVNSPSTSEGSITFDYTPGRAVNSMALFNVTGTEVSIVGTSAIGDGVVYNQSRQTQGSRGPGYWQFYFGEARLMTRFTFFNIPPYSDIVLTVTVTPRGGVTSIGEVVFGNEFYLGEDELGMEPDLKSYSINEFDDNFGYNTLVRRQSRRRLRTTVVVESYRADLVFRTMERLIDERMVWIADKFESGQLYGFYTEFKPVHSSHPLVFARLKVEGLI